MTTKTLVVPLMAFMFSWAGCDSADDPKPSPPLSQDGLIPFRVGATWSYMVTQYDSNGAVFGAILPGGSTIESSLIIGDERWFHYSHGSDWLYRTNRSSGVWTSWSTNFVGLEFTTTLDDSCLTTRSGSYVKLVDLDTVITVPAGTFTCYRYRELFPPYPYSEWVYFIAPGVGIIRRDYYIRYNNGRWFLEAQSVLTSRTP